MTGHIFFMDIDPDLPASMSPAITSKLLRGELGYDGVVITDDLPTMHGAIDVVADLGVFVDDTDIPRVVDALTAEMEADEAFFDRVVAAVQRTLRLHRGLLEPELFPLCGAVGD